MLFLDTCVLSDIGRMSKKRGTSAYNLLVTKKYCIVVSTFQILEIEKIPDKQLISNIYDFLQLIIMMKLI